MCGIAGKFGKLGDVEDLIQTQERLIHRGSDSFGVAIWYDKHLVVIKAEMQDELWDTYKDYIKQHKIEDKEGLIIAHNRKASAGSINYTNAQPVIARKNKLVAVVIHNGTIQKLSKDKSKSDSMQIAELLLKNPDKVSDILKHNPFGVLFMIVGNTTTKEIRLELNKDHARSLFVHMEKPLFASEPTTSGEWGKLDSVSFWTDKPEQVITLLRTNATTTEVIEVADNKIDYGYCKYCINDKNNVIVGEKICLKCKFDGKDELFTYPYSYYYPSYTSVSSTTTKKKSKKKKRRYMYPW